MLGAVLISSLISQQFPKISTPLVQIGLGIALSLLPLSFDVILDPELFLVLFIAPLLFEDAKKADKPALWRLKRPILLLALGLVFATTFVVGFFIHWFMPVIPLAAAFALAAALAPTDAVAVASLKETAAIGEEQDHLLKGESLLNDASGIVSFQFAIAAMLTGAFSLAEASMTFAFMFFGGLILGVVLMVLRAVLVRWLHSSGIESITFHVLFEVITPFLVFLIAELLHVSGIIAVVAAGIAYSFSPRHHTPNNARHNIVSTSAWSVISYSLNGLVFLILGTQLPYVIQRVWSSSAAADNFLLLFIVVILLAILILRFCWVLVMHRNVNLAAGGVEPIVDERASDRSDRFVEAAFSDEAKTLRATSRQTTASPLSGSPAGAFGARSSRSSAALSPDRANVRKTRRREKQAWRRQELAREKKAARTDPRYWALHIHDALLLSLTGAKGAITLAVVLTIPLMLTDGTPFPERDLLIFLASGVILLSLLCANFLVPLVAPKKKEQVRPEHEVEAILEIYRSVICQLIDTIKPGQKAATDELVQQYYARITTLTTNNQLINEQDAEVRRRIIEWEREHTRELISEGKVSALAGIFYLDQLSRTLARIQHHSAVGWEIKAFFEQFASRIKSARAQKKKFKHANEEERSAVRFELHGVRLELRDLVTENYLHVQEKLAEYRKEPDSPAEVIDLISIELERRIVRLRNPRGFLTNAREGFGDHFLEVEARALEFEREAINDALSHKRISRAIAKQMRDNVAMMELDIEEQLE
jgi:CPA1 family monovalent cation:H+ antiporter